MVHISLLPSNYSLAGIHKIETLHIIKTEIVPRPPPSFDASFSKKINKERESLIFKKNGKHHVMV